MPKDVRAEFWKVRDKKMFVFTEHPDIKGYIFVLSYLSYMYIDIRWPNFSFNPSSLELGVSERVTTAGCSGQLEWPTGL